MATQSDKKSHSSNANKTKGRNKEGRPDSATAGAGKDLEKKTLGDDYWDRVAEDVASGYKTNHDESNVLNEDEEPGDYEKAG